MCNNSRKGREVNGGGKKEREHSSPKTLDSDLLFFLKTLMNMSYHTKVESVSAPVSLLWGELAKRRFKVNFQSGGSRYMEFYGADAHVSQNFTV